MNFSLEMGEEGREEEEDPCGLYSFHSAFYIRVVCVAQVFSPFEGNFQEQFRENMFIHLLSRSYVTMWQTCGINHFFIGPMLAIVYTSRWTKCCPPT